MQRRYISVLSLCILGVLLVHPPLVQVWTKGFSAENPASGFLLLMGAWGLLIGLIALIDYQFSRSTRS